MALSIFQPCSILWISFKTPGNFFWASGLVQCWLWWSVDKTGSFFLWLLLCSLYPTNQIGTYCGTIAFLGLRKTWIIWVAGNALSSITWTFWSSCWSGWHQNGFVRLYLPAVVVNQIGSAGNFRSLLSGWSGWHCFAFLRFFHQIWLYK